MWYFYQEVLFCNTEHNVYVFQKWTSFVFLTVVFVSKHKKWTWLRLVSIFFWIFIECSSMLEIMSLHHKEKHNHGNKTVVRANLLGSWSRRAFFTHMVNTSVFAIFLCYTHVIRQRFLWQQFWESSNMNWTHKTHEKNYQAATLRDFTYWLWTAVLKPWV